MHGQQNIKKKRQYGACALHTGSLSPQIRTQNMPYLLIFHSDNGCTNAPQFYVTRTLPVLLTVEFWNYFVD